MFEEFADLLNDCTELEEIVGYRYFGLPHPLLITLPFFFESNQNQIIGLATF